MSITDFERRKALQQTEARAVEHATKLLTRLLSYSEHRNSCHARGEDDPKCTCGYTQLILDIVEFSRR